MAKLEKPLITRFDLIFKFSKSSQDYNSTKIREHFKMCDMLNGVKPDGLLSDHEIKLFINHIKKLKPVLTIEALERSNEFFIKMEQKGNEKGKKGGTETRTENAIIKFAIAIARWHMTETVTAVHIDEALKLYEAGMETFGLHFVDGEDINERTLKDTVDGRIQAIKNAYDSLKTDEGYAHEDKVVDKALTYNCFSSRGQCEAMMGRLRLESKLTEKHKMIKIRWNV
jgi:DNA replicative helicase MCM subunit Mcm2 (Cdc46/Mcm family)